MPINLRRLETAPRPSYAAALAKLEAETIRRVNREMHGQSLDRVHAVLVERLEGRLPGVPHNRQHLHRVAVAISRGTLPVG